MKSSVHARETGPSGMARIRSSLLRGLRHPNRPRRMRLPSLDGRPSLVTRLSSIRDPEEVRRVLLVTRMHHSRCSRHAMSTPRKTTTEALGHLTHAHPPQSHQHVISLTFSLAKTSEVKALLRMFDHPHQPRQVQARITDPSDSSMNRTLAVLRLRGAPRAT